METIYDLKIITKTDRLHTISSRRSRGIYVYVPKCCRCYRHYCAGKVRHHTSHRIRIHTHHQYNLTLQSFSLTL